MVARAPIVDNSGHRPMAPGDTVDTQFIQLSSQTGNQVRVVAGGLYVGNTPTLPMAYVDSVAGTDAPTSGTQATPFRTLDYAITQLTPSMAYDGAIIRFLLKVGQSYPLTGRYAINTNIRIDFGFYGDARGDYTTVLNGATPLWVMNDVARPVINVAPFTNSFGLWSCGGLTSSVVRGEARLYGVKWNVSPASGSVPTIDTYGESDSFMVQTLGLYGAVVNKPDNSPYGLFGIGARSTGQLDQFAARFTVRDNVINVPPNSSITADDLVSRQHFIHFYADFASPVFVTGAARLAPSALTGSNASGVLRLNWTDVTAQAAAGGTTTGTFPVLSDVNYGLTNYFYGLRRDQQSRPLNVISGRLF